VGYSECGLWRDKRRSVFRHKQLVSPSPQILFASLWRSLLVVAVNCVTVAGWSRCLHGCFETSVHCISCHCNSAWNISTSVYQSFIYRLQVRCKKSTSSLPPIGKLQYFNNVRWLLRHYWCLKCLKSLKTTLIMFCNFDMFVKRHIYNTL